MSANAQVRFDVGIQIPGISIGIDLPVMPRPVPVPGLPVYYAPVGSFNYFYYDSLYWVLHGDDWYTASWYDGPWHRVDPFDVPAFVLRVPTRYYRKPPPYFRDGRPEAPPHWDEHWGRGWAGRRADWDHWDYRNPPAATPLPDYQRRFPRDRYPETPEQSRAIRIVNGHPEPHEDFSRRYLTPPSASRSPRQSRPEDNRPQSARPPGNAQVECRSHDQMRPEPSQPSRPRPQAGRRNCVRIDS